jgi:N-hydroxyarylamine O-acetyltransferase
VGLSDPDATVGLVDGIDVDGYLGRLGVRHPGRPSVAGLFAVHRAHVERVPYETLEIQLGRPTTIDPYESAERIVRNQQGGYCYHLNGAFSALLAALGYDVTWHRAGVQRHGLREPPGADGNHLGLTVAALPAPAAPDGRWMVDVGLGDGLYEPIPLRHGVYHQPPYAFALRPSDVEPAGWRLDHDEKGSFAGVDFAADRAETGDFEAQHKYLSTSPESGFVRVMTAQRRHAGGADILRSCTLTRITRGSSQVITLDRRKDWFTALADIFGLTLIGVDDVSRGKLWAKVHSSHLAWIAAGQTGQR